MQKVKAVHDDVLDRLAISDANLATQFAANRARHAEYRAVAPYLARGMIYGEAVVAYGRDHPEAQAAD